LCWQNVFFRLFLHQILRSSRLAIDRTFWTTSSTGRSIFGAFICIMSRRAIPERRTTARALLFSGIFGVLVFLLGLLFPGLLWRHVLQLSLHGARSDWCHFCHLRYYILSLGSFWSFVPFRIQNWVRGLLWGYDTALVRQFLSVFFVLLPFVMVVNDFSGHVRNMGGALSIWLFIDRSTCVWSFYLSVGFTITLLSHISLGI
jgi:hypothetical protein